MAKVLRFPSLPMGNNAENSTSDPRDVDGNAAGRSHEISGSRPTRSDNRPRSNFCRSNVRTSSFRMSDSPLGVSRAPVLLKSEPLACASTHKREGRTFRPRVKNRSHALRIGTQRKLQQPRFVHVLLKTTESASCALGLFPADCKLSRQAGVVGHVERLPAEREFLLHSVFSRISMSSPYWQRCQGSGPA